MAATQPLVPLSFSYDTASAATGLSADVIKRAVKAGDLAVTYPKVNGRPIAKPVIDAEELQRWLRAGATERAA